MDFDTHTFFYAHSEGSKKVRDTWGVPRAKHAAGLAKFARRIKNLQGAVLEKVLFCQVHKKNVDLPSKLAQLAMECSGRHSH